MEGSLEACSHPYIRFFFIRLVVASSQSKHLSRFVPWILSQCDASTTLHTLDFDCIVLEEPHLKSIVKYAVSHNIQGLRIKVKCDIQHFPSCFFSCCTLTSLDHYASRRIYGQLPLFPNSLNLPALTSLSLHYFSFSASNNGRIEPFSTFSQLNSLIIGDCKVRYAQNLCILSSTLANLTIQSYCRQSYREIELSTPSLYTFVYNSNPFLKLSGNCLCSIKHVNIDAYLKCNLKYAESPSILLSWLIELTYIRSLIVSSTTLQVLSLVPDLLKLKLHSLCNLKSLKVKRKPLSYYSSIGLIDAKLAQLPNGSHEEVSEIKEAFKVGSSSIPEGIVDFLLQNSPSVEVNIINYI